MLSIEALTNQDESTLALPACMYDVFYHDAVPPQIFLDLMIVLRV